MKKELSRNLFEMLLTHIKVRSSIKTLAIKMALLQCSLSIHRSEKVVEKLWIKKTADRRHIIKPFEKLWGNLNCQVLGNNSCHCCHLNTFFFNLSKEYFSDDKLHLVFYSSLFSYLHLSTRRLECLFAYFL